MAALFAVSPYPKPGHVAAAAPAIPALQLTAVAKAQLPIGFVSRPGTDLLYVVEKPGRIRLLRNGLLDPDPVLDISDRVSFLVERGLLSVAFTAKDPSKLWVVYTDRAGTWRLSEFPLVNERADRAAERNLIAIAKKTNIHHGGALAFDAEGRLYVSVGDGGPAGDPANKAQRLNVLEGKILRIDPLGRTGSLPYAIPQDNPFATPSLAAVPPRPEIIAYGLRNPWRMTLDAATGQVWIGDVGQSRTEELDVFSPASQAVNFGWRLREGFDSFRGARPPGSVEPVFAYPHASGRCAVIAGPVYRGTRIDGLQGWALFGDFCSGEVRALVPTDAGRSQFRVVDLALKTTELASFGVDSSGELYVVSKTGTIFRIDPKT